MNVLYLLAILSCSFTIVRQHLLLRSYQRELDRAMAGWKETIQAWDKQLAAVQVIVDARDVQRAILHAQDAAMHDLTVTRES